MEVGPPPAYADNPELQESRLVLAIDYGTTFTGVGIATPSSNHAILNEIEIIQNWGLGMGNQQKIPSVISYSLKSPNRERQWGGDLSPQAIAMVHTKLQLDVDDTSTELDLILQALDGMHNLDFAYIRDSGAAPKYTRKAPEEIVEDYLTRVFDYVLDYLLANVESFTEDLRPTLSVVIIATVPAEWGYRAKNSTFRALTRAGFNTETFPTLEMLLVSEPEAAAIYAARYLKERNGADFLRKGECFVLCDAGGGTVDVVSYRVKQLRPTFEIEPVTVPLGAKAGSVFINLAFKMWLRELIGPQRYQVLDQAELIQGISSHDTEGERMRALMKRFDVFKRRFERGHRPIKIDLPPPFENLDLDNRVVGGQITITYNDMASFFEPCANKIVELIQGQLEQVESLRTRPRNVFLVGGFAESRYLQQSIRESLDMRDIELRDVETSWTAVVRGAVIFGIEKSANNELSAMTGAPRSYGVSFDAPYSDVAHVNKDRVVDPLTKTAMAKDQLVWLIKKGDLILSNKPKETECNLNREFTQNESRGGSVPIYSYDEDDIPERLFNARSELTSCYVLEYSLAEFPLQEFTCRKIPGRPPIYTASLCLSMSLTEETLLVELRFKDVVISNFTMYNS